MISILTRKYLIIILICILLLFSLSPILSAGVRVESKDMEDNANQKNSFSHEDSEVYYQEYNKYLNPELKYEQTYYKDSSDNDRPYLEKNMVGSYKDQLLQFCRGNDLWYRLITTYDDYELFKEIPLLLEKTFSSNDSILCGYVNDSQNGLPIENANVNLVWIDDEGYFYFNETSTNGSGFYSFNVPAGQGFITFQAVGYFETYSSFFYLDEDEILWFNISMDPYPPENSVVCGYITDLVSGDPIEDAQIRLYWDDFQGHYYNNNSISDEFGFFSMNTVAGNIYIHVEIDGYFTINTDYYDVGEHETLWLNISLEPHPPENSVVCGFITDVVSGDPIEDADVYLDWRDDNDHYIWNSSSSDDSGFFSMNVAAGEFSLDIYENGYFSLHTDWFEIDEFEIFWLNLSMDPIPPENSVVCGYITDLVSGDPVENANINLDWRDNQGHYDSNYTNSDEFGFFSMNVAAGEFSLDIYENGYFSLHTDWFEIDEFEIFWLNLSMDPIPPENSVVCGYITDLVSGDPVENAQIRLYWDDFQGHYYNNYTYSDEFGFFSMNTAAGNIYLRITAEGYIREYTNWNEIDEDEILWENVSLYPMPPENSIVCGYITDAVTGDPIEDADVNLDWRDDNDHYIWNDTYSNSQGFYSINSAAGTIELHVYADGFLNHHTPYYDIGENEILWINISMYIDPIERSIVCGYITDDITSAPIKSAYVSLDWRDNLGHYYGNYTFTSSSGFFSMNVAKGDVSLFADSDLYQGEKTFWYNIDESDIIWVNISLTPNIEVEIIKPEKALYIMNYRILPFLTTVIIGSLDIEVNISDPEIDVECVEFYIDGQIKSTDNAFPYNWTWNERTPFRNRHTIKVIAYDNAGPYNIDEIIVWKFF